jgi:hypothetical protein
VRWLVVALALLQAARAHADDDDDGDDVVKPQPWHASAGLGGSFLLTGDGGDATRFDAAISFQFPRSKLGVVVAGRAFDDKPRDALVTAGVEYQAAASRPRLVLTLYADVGLETAGKHGVAGFGTRTVFRIIGPLAVIADTGFHFVLDGLDDTTLVIGSALMIGVAR